MSHIKDGLIRGVDQSKSIPGRQMERNEAGGYTFTLDDFGRLERFLILGSEGGTYYVSQAVFTLENAAAVERALASDPERALAIIEDIGTGRRAAKHQPTLLALALAASAQDAETRRKAFALVPRICRTGTHLFQFVDYVGMRRGWGRALKRAVAGWYLGRKPDDAAYQVLKYGQREGWSHRDLLRLSHPKAADPGLDAVFRFAANGVVVDAAPDLIRVHCRLKTAGTPAKAARIIRAHPGISWEMVPSDLRTHAAVWKALFDKLPLGALLRQLPTLTRLGVLTKFRARTRAAATRLTDRSALANARIHPLHMLMAAITYSSGRSTWGSKTWTPVGKIAEALEKGFDLAFESCDPINARLLVAVDVSGSMTCGTICGTPGLTPFEGAAVLAMQIARTAPRHVLKAFSDTLVDLPVTARTPLAEVTSIMRGIVFGATDCALPMLHALENGVPVDTFVVITDNQTWRGKIHPVKALAEYRRRMGIPAKLIVVAMTASRFSIADPDDAGMLDVVGFNAATPSVIARFAEPDVQA